MSLALFPQRPLGAECFGIRGDEPFVSGDDGHSGNGFFGGEAFRKNMARHPAGHGMRLVDDASGMGRLEQYGSLGIHARCAPVCFIALDHRQVCR